MNPITVLLAEDHTVVREGLRSLLQVDPGFTIVAEAENGREAVELVRRHRPAVVVMDIAMPLLNGVEALRRILAFAPETKGLMLSAHGDDEYVFRAISAGASGFLLKQSSAQLLAHALREIVNGRKFFSPVIVKRLADMRGRGVWLHEDKAKLTSREQEVLQLVAEGAPNKRRASEPGISNKTIEKHRQQLMNKLGIHDTAGLTRYAIAAGVIESSVQTTSS
jgi:DNA-binding NarL/FixJ family response regulator